MIVRLHLLIMCLPICAACCTNHLKCGCSSGAPPVISTVCMSVSAKIFRHFCIISRLMVSRRSGPASTWQCLQVWLQRLPTFICNIFIPVACSGYSPIDCSWVAKGVKVPYCSVLFKISSCWAGWAKLLPLANRVFVVFKSCYLSGIISFWPIRRSFFFKPL